MDLVDGSEKDYNWGCDYCEKLKGDIDKEIGEQVKAWRCSEDHRDDPNREQAWSLAISAEKCDYDICSKCMVQYKVR